MTALRAQLSRLPQIAGLFAVAATLGLVVTMSSTDRQLQSAMQRHDSNLKAISERAERIQMLARYVRKASLTSPTDSDVPFAGFIGNARQLAPGSALKFGRAGEAGEHVLEIVSAEKVSLSIELIASSTQPLELMLVTGRATSAPDAPLIRFLVAVTPTKPAPPSGAGIDHQTL